MCVFLWVLMYCKYRGILLRCIYLQIWTRRSILCSVDLTKYELERELRPNQARETKVEYPKNDHNRRLIFLGFPRQVKSSGPLVLPVVLTLVALTHTFLWQHGDMDRGPDICPGQAGAWQQTPGSSSHKNQNQASQKSVSADICYYLFHALFKDFLNRFYQQGINYSRFYLLSAHFGMCEGQTA